MTILPNIPRDFTAIAEWVSCIIIFIQLPKNERTKKSVLILFWMLIGQIVLQRMVGVWPLLFWIPGMMLNVFWMFLTLKFSTTLSLNENIYNVCKAFIFAEFIASLAWQLYCYTFLEVSHSGIIFEYLFILVLYAVFGAIYYYFDHKNQKPTQLVIRKKDVIVGALTAIIIFTMSNIGFLLSNTSFSLGDSFAIFIFRSLINLCGILIFYIQENQKYESFLQEELSSINNVFHSQYEQYQAFKESNAIIDRKFHDLKHQINLIELETNTKKRQEYFKQLREDIKKYESSIKTGNAVMDTILTRKNVFCVQNGIALTCIADGSLLDFLSVMDICSLLGNSLDNAVESVLKTTNHEKRLINLRVLEKANFVLFSIENYTEIQPNFENGLPKTTKKDQTFHGYGLKSISYIAEKYNGTMTIDFKNNWFTLNVLIPHDR